MTRQIAVSCLALLCLACAQDRPRTYDWPDISFVVIDEIAEAFVFERAKDFVPSAGRILLLPIVENFEYEGRRHRFALTDPIVVHPGERTMRETFRQLSSNSQTVRHCIVLAQGYCPGILQPVINYAGSHRGKDAWLVELAKLSEAQFEGAAKSIAAELTGQRLIVGGLDTFEGAVVKGTVLRTAETRSPVVREGGFRNMPIGLTPKTR